MSAVMAHGLLQRLLWPGVRQKVLLVLLTVLACALTLSGTWMINEQKEIRLKEIDRRAQDISGYLARSVVYSVVGYDYHTIQLFLNDIVGSNDIIYARVENNRGNKMAEQGHIPANPENVVEFARDIVLDEEVVGKLAIALSTTNILQQTEKQKYSMFLREAVIIVLIAVGEFVALSFLIIRPVKIISNSLQSTSETALLAQDIPLDSHDEFGLLARQFNDLRHQLDAANRQLHTKIEVADQKLLTTNRQLIQQSYELKRINEELKMMSITDALTNLYNRRQLDAFLETEIAVATRHAEDLSLLMLDIDHFKKINDTYGHEVGDKVIQHVSKILRERVRKSDVVCRYGGEEFIVMLKRADAEFANSIAEKLRLAIAQEPPAEVDAALHVTVSVGVTTLASGHPPCAKEELLRTVDTALYYSKQHGRNRVTHSMEIATASPGSIGDHI